jgi:hypothetical protein
VADQDFHIAAVRDRMRGVLLAALPKGWTVQKHEFTFQASDWRVAASLQQSHRRCEFVAFTPHVVLGMLPIESALRTLKPSPSFFGRGAVYYDVPLDFLGRRVQVGKFGFAIQEWSELEELGVIMAEALEIGKALLMPFVGLERHAHEPDGGCRKPVQSWSGSPRGFIIQATAQALVGERAEALRTVQESLTCPSLAKSTVPELERFIQAFVRHFALD